MTKPLTIGDVMTANLWVIAEDAPLRQARYLMVEHEIHHLPVVQGGRSVGMLTDRDVKRALDPDLGLPPEDELFVRDVCVYDVYAVHAAEPLEHVLREMAARHIGSALVVEGGHVRGILTASDACRVFADFLHAAQTPLLAPGSGERRPSHPGAGAPGV